MRGRNVHNHSRLQSPEQSPWPSPSHAPAVNSQAVLAPASMNAYEEVTAHHQTAAAPAAGSNRLTRSRRACCRPTLHRDRHECKRHSVSPTNNPVTSFTRQAPVSPVLRHRPARESPNRWRSTSPRSWRPQPRRRTRPQAKSPNSTVVATDDATTHHRRVSDHQQRAFAPPPAV